MRARDRIYPASLEILRRDIDKYIAQSNTSRWVFFDRGVIDALGLLQEVSPLPQLELEALLDTFPFHRSVFILPPWEAIYLNDAERDQSFPEAVDVHEKLTRWYESCGYVLHEVPRLSVQERADYIVRILNDGGEA